jgi:hypothetical protein
VNPLCLAEVKKVELYPCYSNQAGAPIVIVASNAGMFKNFQIMLLLEF